MRYKIYLNITCSNRGYSKKKLEKAFITTKFTQCKTSMDSTYQIIKILENYFKIFTAFSDQANSSSGPSQILILQFPIPRAYLTIFCQTLPEPSETLLQHSLHHVLNRFPYFVPPNLTTRHHKYQIYQSICQVKPIKFIFKLYSGHSTFQVKEASHQKDSL